MLRQEKTLAIVFLDYLSTPQYSANRSIRNQHQKTFADRGKLSQFFSGTISAYPCTLPKKTCRDSNKKCEITPPSLGGGGPTRECFRVSCRRKVLPKSSPPSIEAFCPPPVWGGGKVRKAVPGSVLLHRNAGTVTPKW